MKTLVLSGGMGSRLRPRADRMPRRLVPLAGDPVLTRCPTPVGDRAPLRRAGTERSVVQDGARPIGSGGVQDRPAGPEATITERASGAPDSVLTAGDHARTAVGT
ncbi:hypothetical protein [Streptomyces sp. BE147]|uniref:hypothetical protein n=1 Tax=unclassified Streptomyces TaxID=2593676 RepID=UPI002E7A65C3|nr:hypothetical protein [Streptomyces sp. BE147]MEE1742654.1 hypothetical protein [Streptomyces sp. BE147]